jgi:hypothetical protein
MSNDTLPIDINPQHKRIRWHLRQTTVEIGLNDRGQRAHAAKKNNKKKTKKLHSAKLNAPQPNLLQMIRRRAMCRGNQLDCAASTCATLSIARPRSCGPLD